MTEPPTTAQVRCLTRVLTPDDYDAAARLRPETCPMYYMGDRRTGRQLLADLDADAAVTVAALARHLAQTAAGAAGDDAVARSGYMGAYGGRGLLEGMAGAVGRLVEFLAQAGPGGATADAWARAVRAVSAALRCVPRRRIPAHAQACQLVNAHAYAHLVRRDDAHPYTRAHSQLADDSRRRRRAGTRDRRALAAATEVNSSSRRPCTRCVR